MAFQGGIELSRLRAHRFPDHYVTRGRATSRPVSQTSTPDQASGYAGAEFAQPSPSTLPGSIYTTQDASQNIPSSNDKYPLIFPQRAESPDQGVGTSTGKRTSSVPWTLRRRSLLGLIAFLVALIVTLEVLYRFSNNNQGLVTAEQDASYLWKYLPTASKCRSVQSRWRTPI
jgi:hypothetical protein